MISIYVDAYRKRQDSSIFGTFKFIAVPRIGEIVFLYPNEPNEVRLTVNTVTHFSGTGDGTGPNCRIHLTGDVIE